MEMINLEENQREKRGGFEFWNGKRDARVFKLIAAAVVVFASAIIIKDEILWQFSDDDFFEDEYLEQTDEGERGCNVLGIELRGELATYILPNNPDAEYDGCASEDILYSIETAEEDASIKAIILEIDSYGGNPVAAEEVAVALKNAKKPTVALIRGAGVSAAYFAATGADIIFASKNSDVGGIGVTMSYLDYSRQDQEDGLTYNQLSSGEFKDAGDPDKPLTAKERDLLMRDVNIMHQNFVEAVAQNRDLDIEKVKILADGATMLGQMAQENGLIDQIGGWPEMQKYLEEKIGQDLEICW